MNAEKRVSGRDTRVLYETEKEHRGPLWWWYRISAPDEKIEASQLGGIYRGRLASILILISFIVSGAFLPAALTSDGLHVLPPVIGMFIVSCIAIPLNRSGRTTAVGVLFLCAIDFALISSLLFYPGFVLTQNAVPIYDLFVLSDIIAVSLLPARSILYVSFFHSIFMCADIAFQPHTPDLEYLLTSTNYSIMVRPLTIQIVVALIMYLWVSSAMKAVERANRAEEVAQLERTIAQQKEDLDEGIQQILHTLVQAANGDLRVRTPLAREHVLWQVDVALNTLLSRLQRANISERELHLMRKDMQRLVLNVRSIKGRRAVFWVKPVGTHLDPLVNELLNCYVVPSSSPPPPSPPPSK